MMKIDLICRQNLILVLQEKKREISGIVCERVYRYISKGEYWLSLYKIICKTQLLVLVMKWKSFFL